MTAAAPHLRHLTRRFLASLRPSAPTEVQQAWARARLTGAEWAIWSAQPDADRRHSVCVAEDLVDRHADAPSWVVAAALLHDVGKTDAVLGVAGRVVAGMLALVGVRRAPGRIGRHLRYPAIGAEWLARAGSDPRVVAWAAQHHEPATTWTVPTPWAGRLAAADERSV